MKHGKQMFWEHTRIVDTIQKLHRACTNNAPNMHEESRRKCRQGEKWKFLVERMGEKYAWPCVKYKWVPVKKLVIKKWILPVNKRLPIIHYRCFVMKSFLGCWVPNPFSHMYYVTQNLNTFFITFKWGKKQHSQSFNLRYLNTLFLPLNRLLRSNLAMRWGICLNHNPHLLLDGETLPKTPTLFQATGRLWSPGAGGLKQGGTEGGGGRGWAEQVNSYIGRWREEPMSSSSKQKITVWAYFLYQQGGSRKKNLNI